MKKDQKKEKKGGKLKGNRENKNTPRRRKKTNKSRLERSTCALDI